MSLVNMRVLLLLSGGLPGSKATDTVVDVLSYTSNIPQNDIGNPIPGLSLPILQTVPVRGLKGHQHPTNDGYCTHYI